MEKILWVKFSLRGVETWFLLVWNRKKVGNLLEEDLTQRRKATKDAKKRRKRAFPPKIEILVFAQYFIKNFVR